MVVRERIICPGLGREYAVQGKCGEATVGWNNWVSELNEHTVGYQLKEYGNSPHRRPRVKSKHILSKNFHSGTPLEFYRP